MLLCSLPGVRVKRSVVTVVLVNTPTTYVKTVVRGVGTFQPVRPDTVCVFTVVCEVNAAATAVKEFSVTVGFPTSEAGEDGVKHSVKVKRTQ